MGTVVSLVGYAPPARYDDVPWTGVRWFEAATPAGPFVQIDDQVLTVPDPDPSAPGARNLTTTNATLEVGWYELVFYDAGLNLSDASDPIRNPPGGQDLPPDPDAVRNASPLLRQAYPIPATDPYAANDLRSAVAQATALVQTLTWRLIDPTLGDLSPEGYASEAVPAGLVPVAFEAVSLMTERVVVGRQPDNAEMFALGRHLRGFSAGPYSESYFAPGEFARRGAQQSRPAMDQDDALDSALWALATEDARDYFVFRATGVAPPIGSVTGFDYRRQSLGYGAGEAGGWPGGLGRGGPDGF